MKRLIAVDGLDGCGKDSHAARIKELIEAEGGHVTIVSHPSQRTFGKLSKRALQGSGHVPRALATLFYTADVLCSVRRYKRTREGTVVFVRYLLGTAYLPRWLAPYGYRLFRGLLPFPDLPIFIDIDPAVALRRIEQRDHAREMFETIERLESVRKVARRLTSDGWSVVDNSEDGDAPFLALARLLAEKGFLSGDARLSHGSP